MLACSKVDIGADPVSIASICPVYHRLDATPRMNKQAGFTLLELVIALAIFALLGLASGRLFSTVVRAQQGTASHEQNCVRLQRAIAVIERDALRVASSVFAFMYTTCTSSHSLA